MKWVKLRAIYGERFRSFTEPFRVELPSSGLVLIKGTNLNTGDSSGSGKSSLVLAISHLLGGCPFPGTELQSWLSEDPFCIGVEIENQEGLWVVERSPGLKVVSPSGKIAKGRAAELEIDTIFGMDAKMRALTTYRGQGQDGLFLSMPDSDKKEFLARALGLDKYEVAVTTAIAELKDKRASSLLIEDRRKSAVVELETARARLAEVDAPSPDDSEEEALLAEVDAPSPDDSEEESLLSVCQKNLDTASERKKELSEVLIEIKKTISADVNADIQRTQKELKEVLNEGPPEQLVLKRGEVLTLNQRIEELGRSDTKRRMEVEREKNDLKLKIKDAASALNDAKRLREEIEEVKTRISHLEKQSCPTCLQTWVKSQNQLDESVKRLADKEAALESVLETASGKDELESRLAGIPEFSPNPDILVLASDITNGNAVIELMTKEHTRLRSETVSYWQAEETKIRNTGLKKIADESEPYLARIIYIEEEMKADNKTIGIIKEVRHKREMARSVIKERIKEVRHKREMARSVIKERTESLDIADKKLKKMISEESKINEERDRLADFTDMVGREGFLGVIFDDALAEISAATNDILSMVSNVRHISFSFESEKETQSGGFQRRIIPVVTIAGRRVSLTSGLSGGQQSAVNLAVDLGFGEVVAKRRGSYPGWLVLDESFDGLGKTSKESCLEMLNSYASNNGERTILVIDHSSEFQGLFSQMISVIMSGESSTIEG
jgi:DNA repair exonuclease SbcCD ATPase subunit